MDLITPAFGLIFWQTLIFLIVLFVLGKFAWKPIIHALKTREDSIDGALKSAQQAREEMEKLKVENEKLLAAAREERNNMMKDAGKVANELKDAAKKDAEKIGEKMIEDARATINSEKDEAIKSIRNQVVDLSIQITERLLKKDLEGDKSQESLIKEYIKDLKLN